MQAQVSHDGTAPPVPWSHALAIAALVLAQALCGVFASVASSDTSRDVFVAQQIAAGAWFPLTGPGINGMLYLGPLWYYLLAMPAWLVPNAASVTGAMGLASGLQFPLAYALGRRLLSAREGLVFALCLALPGWIVTTFGSLTHPVLTMPSLLLGAFAVLAYRARPTAWQALVMGAALALMAAAHPTLAFPGLVMVACCAPRAPSLPRLAAHVALMALVVAATFLPMAWEQWIARAPDFARAGDWSRSEWSMPSLLAGLELLHAVAWYGPQYVTRFWLGAPDGVASALLALYAFVLAAAAAGLVLAGRDRARRRLAGGLAALALLHAIFLCAIREAMPPWMVYALWLPLAALLALGLAAWWSRRAGAWVPVLLAATTLWTVAIYAELGSGDTEFRNIAQSPGRIGFMDVRHYEEAMSTFRVSRVPFRRLYELGPPLCAPVALYGHYAYQVDYTYAVSAAHACGRTDQVRFGGMPEAGRAGWLGLHEHAWRALGAEPARRLATLGLVPVDAVWHSPVALAPVVPALSNFPRRFEVAARDVRVQGAAPRGHAVLVSHRASRYLPFEVLRARADGREVAPVYRDVTSAVFAAPPGPGAAVHWEVDVHAHPDYIDVLSFAPAR